jgi:hypothetical protein
MMIKRDSLSLALFCMQVGKQEMRRKKEKKNKKNDFSLDEIVFPCISCCFQLNVATPIYSRWKIYFLTRAWG